MEQLLTVDQVAQLLQVKPRTIYQWVHESFIPVVKLGCLVRFKQASIKEWLTRREAAGRQSRRLNLDVT